MTRLKASDSTQKIVGCVEKQAGQLPHPVLEIMDGQRKGFELKIGLKELEILEFIQQIKEEIKNHVSNFSQLIIKIVIKASP
jgi:hypothetical protein